MISGGFQGIGREADVIYNGVRLPEMAARSDFLKARQVVWEKGQTIAVQYGGVTHYGRQACVIVVIGGVGYWVAKRV